MKTHLDMHRMLQRAERGELTKEEMVALVRVGIAADSACMFDWSQPLDVLRVKSMNDLRTAVRKI